MSVPAPAPYFLFPGTAREAMTLYQRVFGGELDVHTYGEFNRADGPAEAVAHGCLTGPVSVFAADAGADEDGFSSTGLWFSLLGVADPGTLRQWFATLGADGVVVDPLQQRPWGAWDGKVRDAFGVIWLIGFEPSATE